MPTAGLLRGQGGDVGETTLGEPLSKTVVQGTLAVVETMLDVDENPITNAGYIDFDLTPAVPANAEGRMHWDEDAGTVAIGMPGGNVRLQVGQEGLIPVRNVSGAEIANGKLVYTSGSVGNKLTIELADNTDSDTMFLLGMTTETIANNSRIDSSSKAILRQF